MQAAPRLVLISFVCSLFFAEISQAQTVWGVEGTVPSYGEFNAPPPCPTAPPPYAINFPPASCAPNAPFPVGGCRIGGSAVDNDGNVFSGGPSVPAFIHSDSLVLEMTDYSGALILSMPVPPGAILPFPISGVGYDSAADIIWITDGISAAGVGLAPCALPPVIVPPFPIPVPAGTPVTGLGWDPCTGTLWASECAGFVVNFTTAGVPISSFFAGAITVPTALTVNTTNGNIQVTDGATVAEYTPAGALAPPGAFYLSINPYPVPFWGAPIDGLGFSLRPQKYGRECPAGGPTIDSTGGYPFAGNFGFGLTQTGATPGFTAILILSLAPACPAIPIAGCPAGTGLWVLPPFLTTIGAGIVPGSGTVTVPIPLPPATPPCGLPVGIGIFGQFINIGSGLEATDGISFTIGQV